MSIEEVEIGDLVGHKLVLGILHIVYGETGNPLFSKTITWSVDKPITMFYSCVNKAVKNYIDYVHYKVVK